MKPKIPDGEYEVTIQYEHGLVHGPKTVDTYTFTTKVSAMVDPAKEAVEFLTEKLKTVDPSKWEFNANAPFYVQMRKPNPSLSKSDSVRPDYWNYEDGIYAVAAIKHVPLLLEYIKHLESKVENSTNDKKVQ